MDIILAGDFFPATINNSSTSTDLDKLWGDLKPELYDCDLRIINLEAPLTDRGKPIEKTGPNLRSPSASIKALTHANIDVVTLANNHIFDYGQLGLQDTLDICRRNKITTVGAGCSLDEAKQHVIFRVKGKSVAIVNFAENEWANASPTRGGANPMDIVDNVRQIRNAAKSADIVLVIIHGGHEFFEYPNHAMVKTFRFYAEEGASCIICHHAHCVSSYEIHNGVPIFYGLGNLFFPLQTSFANWYIGMAVKLSFAESNQLSFKLIPFRHNPSGIVMFNDEEKQLFIKEIQDNHCLIGNEHELTSKWNSFIDKKMDYYLLNVFIPFKFLQKIVGKLGIVRYLISREHAKRVLNAFRCEAHRTATLAALSKHLNGD